MCELYVIDMFRFLMMLKINCQYQLKNQTLRHTCETCASAISKKKGKKKVHMYRDEEGVNKE